MALPDHVEGMKMCVTITKEGVRIYGNKQAFHTLAKWISWTADGKEKESYEFHLPWTIKAPELLEEDQGLGNVWMLFDKTTYPIYSQALGQDEEVMFNFQAIDDKHLKELSQFRSSGLLPDNWADKVE